MRFNNYLLLPPFSHQVAKFLWFHIRSSLNSCTHPFISTARTGFWTVILKQENYSSWYHHRALFCLSYLFSSVARILLKYRLYYITISQTYMFEFEFDLYNLFGIFYLLCTPAKRLKGKLSFLRYIIRSGLWLFI